MPVHENRCLRHRSAFRTAVIERAMANAAVQLVETAGGRSQVFTRIDGDFWHGTWEGDESQLRRIDVRTGEVLESLAMPTGVGVSGLEFDGGALFLLWRRKKREGESGPPS